MTGARSDRHAREADRCAAWVDRRRTAAAGALRRRARSAGADEVGGAGARVRRRARRRLLDLAPAREERAAVLFGTSTSRRDRARTSSTRTCACCSTVGVDDRRDRVPARATCRRRRSTLSSATAGGGAVRAAQSRRGVAEQALAGRSGSARSRRSCARFAGCAPVVLWGPGEEALAQRGRRGLRRRRAAGAARRRSPICSRWRARASLMVSGDTGPLHIAAAVGHADRRHLRADRSRAQRSVVAGRHRRVAVSGVRLPLRAALPPVSLVPERCAVAEVTAAIQHRRPSQCRGDSAACLVDRVRERPRRRRGQLRPSMSRVLNWLARWRVRSGSPPALVALVAGAADARARWRSARSSRSSARLLRIWAAGHLEKGARGDGVGAVPADAASALSRLDDHRRRLRDRVGAASSSRCSSSAIWRHADRGDRDRGGAPDREVRRRVSGVPRRARDGGRAAFQPGAGDAEPRVSRRRSAWLVALALLAWKAL